MPAYIYVSYACFCMRMCETVDVQTPFTLYIIYLSQTYQINAAVIVILLPLFPSLTYLSEKYVYSYTSYCIYDLMILNVCLQQSSFVDSFNNSVGDNSYNLY